MTEFKMLTDEELEKVIGGIKWKSYGQCILSNGGGSIPALAELVEAIAQFDWPKVAKLSVSNGINTNPVVVKCWANN